MKLRIFVPIICIALLLLVSSVSAGGAESTLDDQATLRISTSAAENPLAQVAGAPDVPAGGEQPSWVGSLVLVFGGLLGGVWLLAGMLAILREIGDTRPRSESAELPPLSSCGKRDEAPPADWL
jgi:hypothetical protein